MYFGVIVFGRYCISELLTFGVIRGRFRVFWIIFLMELFTLFYSFQHKHLKMFFFLNDLQFSFGVIVFMSWDLDKPRFAFPCSHAILVKDQLFLVQIGRSPTFTKACCFETLLFLKRLTTSKHSNRQFVGDPLWSLYPKLQSIPVRFWNYIAQIVFQYWITILNTVLSFCPSVLLWKCVGVC